MARILIVEDNRDNLELMQYLLSAFGHVLLTAENGEAGIDMARREHPDLVLCDIHLPGADGYAVVRELRRDPAFDSVPMIAVTALAMLGDREKGLAAGFDGYISKPIDPQALVADVDRHLRAEQRGAAPLVGSIDPTPRPPTKPTLATVLVVDDSTTNLELIYQTLMPFGYRVRMASSVPEALALAPGLKPDLILSDLHMPDNDGFQLIRTLKAHAELVRVPIILITSSVWGERDRNMAMQLGAARFLLRPIEPQQLLEEVAWCLAAHRERTDGSDPGR
jgi:two-component system cell cycle response regulator